MTRDADLKKLVRARMAQTGTTYTAARAQLLAQSPPDPARSPSQVVTPPAAPDATRPASPDPARAAYDRTIRAFVDGDRLRSIPARRKPRAAVLLHLLARFQGGRDYTEAEVNEILRAAHEDYAWLRRELVNYRYLTRSAAVYRVAAAPPARDVTEAQEVPAHEAEVIAALNALR